MDNDLLAALRDGVNSGAVPRPIDGESIDDYRFRAAHAGALIGVQWARARAEEAAYFAALEDDEHDTSDTTGQGWRHGDSPVTAPSPDVGDPEQIVAADG